ncbi:hypothetical protein PSTG_09066 [Puccinia striiformis f. sp. tritici PST-78]|uniref:Uncharacterized protein n=1 Tax=Puccinia striiformis f. sp. tritici PST-78 TaxID=1165861 RepID=A0A0L0VEP0_9BASI|nr:hypothetical protein PSTG_09066 [Puccinia striiformis f. sp. tritici PST-78]
MLSETLASAYKDCFDAKWPNGTGVDPINLFGDGEIKKIMDNFGAIDGVSSVRKIMGGHTVPGQFEALYKVLEDFENGPVANEESVRKAKEAASVKKKAEEDALAERRAEAQAILDEVNRVERGKREARERIEDAWKEE